MTPLLCALGFGCAVAVTPAVALSGFGSEGQGAGQFVNPTGITLEQESGDAYIVDRGNSRIDKFGPDGEFLLAWGWGVADEGPNTFQTCEATCVAGSSGEGSGQFGSRTFGAAVDNDPLSPSDGDVYVEDAGNSRIEKFSASGVFLLMFGGEVNKATKGDVCLAGEECEAGSEAEEALPGKFERLSANAIAVDSSGAVYVGDNSRVQKFSEGGLVEEEITLAGCGNVLALAVGASGLYALCSELTGVHKYNSSGEEVETLVANANTEFNSSSVLTLSSVGDVFVDASEGERLLEYGSSGEQLLSVHEEEAGGMVFREGTQQLYLVAPTNVRVAGLPPAGPVVEAEEAVAQPAETTIVDATVDPEGKQTRYHVDYGLEEANETETPTATMVGDGFEPEAIEVDLTGLRPASTYHFHLVVENASGTPPSTDETFTTLPAVSIDSESASQVTASSARLATQINPRGLTTAYHFEYLTEAEYDADGESFSGVDTPIPAPDPGGDAGSGISDVALNVLVEDLTPGTTYHYRVVATNECEAVAHPDHECVADGADSTFTTQSGEGSSLIDGRGWEMVSPSDKHGAALEAITKEGGILQAAESGDRMAYIARAPIDSEPAGSRSFAEQQLLATHGSQGWSTQDVATAHEAVAGLRGGELSEYKLFSNDLSAGVVEATGATPLSNEASEATPYVREADGEFVPLVSGCPAMGELCEAIVEEHADVPPGTKFGLLEEEGRVSPNTGVEFVSATPDLSAMVLTARQSLTAGFETEEQRSLYEWRRGEPKASIQPISIFEDGMTATEQGGAALGARDKSVRNAISATGDRVFFSTEAGHLFARDLTEAKTLLVDKPEEGVGASAGSAIFQDASSTGDRVFFTDEARLTSDATSEAGRPDLYMCEVSSALSAGEPDCSRHLKDLTPTVGANGAANVLGAIIGANEEGTQVYFVATGVLTEAPNGVGEAAKSGEPNLYRVDTSTGDIVLVAVLSNSDSPDWEAINPEHVSLNEVTARVSPNGQFLAFMSQRSLTDYNNRDLASEQPDEEVFEYDAQTERIVCASCDPSGARPKGVLDPGVEEPSLLVDRSQTWAGKWFAALIPGWTSVNSEHALYQSRYLSDEGRLFFDSSVGLVPGDGNGTQDVYEFEPEGVGGCSSGVRSADSVFVREVGGAAVDGCVGLISSGSSSEESAFLDASASGDDVFFLTAAKLSPSDTDDALDVYDAHVCGVGWACPSGSASVSPACDTAESCRVSPTPLPGVFGAPASATFSGPGDAAPPMVQASKVAVRPLTRAQKLSKALKACRSKHQRRKRLTCEAQARKRYGPVRKANKSAAKANKSSLQARTGDRRAVR